MSAERKPRFRLAAAACIAILSGCFPQGGVESSLLTSSSRDALTTTTVELGALRMGTSQRLEFAFDDGTGCACAITSSGNALSGRLRADECVGSGGVSDDECRVFAGDYDYADAEGGARICDGGGCRTY